MKNSLQRTFRDHTEQYDEELLAGLDYLLVELGKRGMHAVIYLNNFWEWSGGMGTYLYWTNGGDYIDLPTLFGTDSRISTGSINKGNNG